MFKKLINNPEQEEIEVLIEKVSGGYIVKDRYNTLTKKQYVCANKDQLLALIDSLFKV